MIKNVVFDVGKVLVDFNWQGFFESLNFTPEVYEKVADATVRSKLWNEFDRSKMSDEEILQGFLEGAPGCEAQVMRFWNNIGNCIKCYDYTSSWIQSLHFKREHSPVHILHKGKLLYALGIDTSGII